MYRRRVLAHGRLPTFRAAPAAVTLFVVLVLGLSWLRLLPPIAAREAGIVVPAPIGEVVLPALGTFAPLWAALLVTSGPLGGPGVGALLGQILRWRAAWQWYALALAGPLLLFGLALGAALLAGSSRPSRLLRPARQGRRAAVRDRGRQRRPAQQSGGGGGEDIGHPDGSRLSPGRPYRESTRRALWPARGGAGNRTRLRRFELRLPGLRQARLR